MYIVFLGNWGFHLSDYSGCELYFPRLGGLYGAGYSEEEQADIMDRMLGRMSLEEVADKYGITREKVRQR